MDSSRGRFCSASLVLLGLIIGLARAGAAEPSTSPPTGSAGPGAPPALRGAPRREAPGAPLPTDGERRWIEVPGPDRGILRAVVVWPEGTGPASVVLVLHGTEGFGEDEIRLAEGFAHAGFLGVAGCWFAGDQCPHGPLFQGATWEAVRGARALIAAAVALPRARAERVGLFGHSRGGTVALLVASTGGDVQAVVASSAQQVAQVAGGKRPIPIDVLPSTLVTRLLAPVLLLHSVTDAVTDVQHAREYERALRDHGKLVEAHYYDAAPHELAFFPGTRDDVLRRAIEFFTRRLTP